MLVDCVVVRKLERWKEKEKRNWISMIDEILIKGLFSLKIMVEYYGFSPLSFDCSSRFMPEIEWLAHHSKCQQAIADSSTEAPSAESYD